MQVSVLLFSVLFVALGSARTVLWTNAGGNNLWNNAGNWDCRCLPGPTDDVVIDIQTIPGDVLVGGVIAPALCNSLRIGGSSSFPQTLTLTGAINVGSGKSQLNTNGSIILKAGPDAPFQNDGTFTIHGKGFVFSSGVLAGSGSFVFAKDGIFNLTSSASKMISTNIMVNGQVLTHTDMSTNLVLKGGNVNIDGSFTTGTSLTITSDSASTFTIKGPLSFAGPTLLLQGPGFNFANWVVSGQSSVIINNGIISGTLNVAQGGIVTLIGAVTEKRTFDKVIGGGTFQNQGGNNFFNNFVASGFQGAGGNATIQAGSISSLTLTGAFLGGAKILATTATLSGGFIQGGLQLQASTLNIQGTLSIVDDGTALIVGQTGSISSTSLITLTGGSSLQIATGASLKQSAGFQIVQGAPTSQAPSVINNGQFISSAALTVSGVPFTGTGSYSLDSVASWTLTNVAFSAKSLASQGAIALSAGTFNVATISGTGSFNGNPNSFNSNSLSAAVFSLNSGNASVGNLTVTTLNVQNGGIFSVATTGKIGTFNFLGGKLAGSNSAQQATVTSQMTVFKGSSTQTIANLALASGAISLECGSGNCQLFTSNAALRTIKQ